MPGRFEAYVRRWRLAFNGENGRAMMGGLASVLGDRAELEARQAVREGFATEGSDATAISLLGADVLLDQGPSGYDGGYRERVARALTQWRWAGTDLGLLVALHYSGFELGVIASQSGAATSLDADPVLDDLEDAVALPSWATYYTLPVANPAIPASTDGKAAIPIGTVPWWTITGSQMDADGNQWNGRFDIVFPSGLPGPMALSTSENLTRIRRVIAKWRPASKLCSRIIVVTAGDLWDWPIDEWNNPVDVWPAVVTVDYYTP